MNRWSAPPCRLEIGLLPLFCLILFGVGCRTKKTKPDASTVTHPPGKVVITSTPTGAAVILDEEQRMGHTPITLQRPAFSRLNLQVIKDGYQTYRSHKIIEPGKRSKIHAVLRIKQGYLIVKAGMFRGAKVFINGEYKGKTPIRLEVDSVREHFVEVKMQRMNPFSLKVSLKAGETKSVQAVLVPLGKRRKPSSATDRP